MLHYMRGPVIRSMNLEELKTRGPRWFTCQTIGKDKYGRKITQSAEYVDTMLGRMELSKWYAAVKLAAIEEGKSDLLEAIKRHCRTHCAWLKNEKEVENYALECLEEEAYKAWEDFQPENKEAIT